MTRSCRSALLLLVVFVAAWSTVGAAGGQTGPEFTVAPNLGISDDFAGFGAQLNQHVYADISGPPPGLPNMEGKVIALGPQFVRIFFNTSEWTFKDRMASFQRTVALAERAQSQINITWQGSSFTFAMTNMPRFADVLAGILDSWPGSLWVTLFNEPNSTRLTLAQYQQVYRALDGALNDRGIRDRVHFMGGDLVGTKSPLGQSQADWFSYMAANMGDLLDAWSIHVYWDFWDVGKIDRRLAAEVRTIYGATPEQERRPIYVTEFGVRGLPTFDGEGEVSPGLWPDGTPLEETAAAGFEEAWFMVRAMALGYSGFSKWDMYPGQYDNGKGNYSILGSSSDGWPVRPIYRLLQLMTITTEPRGGQIVDVLRAPGSDPKKLLAAYVSPAGGTTVFGLDTDGSIVEGADGTVAYSVGGLPPNTLFRLFFWNGDGTGKNIEIGFLDSGPSGTIEFSAPAQAVFALTDTSLGPLPW